MKQQALSGFEKYSKTTRRAQFLAEMDRVMPWNYHPGCSRRHRR